MESAPAAENMELEPKQAKHRPSQVDLLDANMDIASSSEDEGQIIDSSRNPSTQPQAMLKRPRSGEHSEDEEFEPELAETLDREGYTEQPVMLDSGPDDAKDPSAEDMDLDHYEYEPTDVTPLQGSPDAAISIQSSDEEMGKEVLDNTYSPILDQGNVEPTQSPPSPSPERRPSSSAQEEGEVSDGSHLDSDDYEPPEPSIPVDNETAADSSPEPLYHEAESAQTSEAREADFRPMISASNADPDAVDDSANDVLNTVIDQTGPIFAQDDDDAGSSAEVCFPSPQH